MERLNFFRRLGKAAALAVPNTTMTAQRIALGSAAGRQSASTLLHAGPTPAAQHRPTRYGRRLPSQANPRT